MKIGNTKSRSAAIAALVALGLVASALAVTGDGSALSPTEPVRSDVPAGSWPYQTGALAGTSETFVDMDGDGSYFDPSLGRRVSRKPFWPYETGSLAGTSETFVDMHDDGSYYDPSLGRRVSRAE
jgi:hypothetical protein